MNSHISPDLVKLRHSGVPVQLFFTVEYDITTKINKQKIAVEFLQFYPKNIAKKESKFKCRKYIATGVWHHRKVYGTL